MRARRLRRRRTTHGTTRLSTRRGRGHRRGSVPPALALSHSSPATTAHLHRTKRVHGAARSQVVAAILLTPPQETPRPPAPHGRTLPGTPTCPRAHGRGGCGRRRGRGRRGHRSRGGRPDGGKNLAMDEARRRRPPTRHGLYGQSAPSIERRGRRSGRHGSTARFSTCVNDGGKVSVCSLAHVLSRGTSTFDDHWKKDSL